MKFEIEPYDMLMQLHARMGAQEHHLRELQLENQKLSLCLREQAQLLKQLQNHGVIMGESIGHILNHPSLSK